MTMLTEEKESDFIKYVHSSLRRRYKEVGNEDKVWREHIQNEDQLEHYSVSMESLAEGQWKSTCNTNRINWCSDVCRDYFLNSGYQKVKQKEKRRQLFHAEKIEGNSHAGEEYKMTESNAEEPWKFQSGDEKLFLLDVGSCYHPFKQLQDQFKVIALDLFPSRKDVFKADFLDLQVVELREKRKHREQDITVDCISEILRKCFADSDQYSAPPHTTEVKTDDKTNKSSTSKFIDCCKKCFIDQMTTSFHEQFVEQRKVSTSSDSGLCNDNMGDLRNSKDCMVENSKQNFASLRCLPSEIFDVVVFSLFLSYFPSSTQRFNCCLKARQLLRHDGLLLVIESDSSHVNRNVHMVKSWKRCLEMVGFSRFKYEKHKHLHCMAFRKVNDTKSIYEKDPSLMFIPQDFQEDYAVEMNAEQSDRSLQEENEVVGAFDLLPMTSEL